MKYQLVFPACLLLLWTLTAFVSAADEKKNEQIKVKQLGGGKIELVCPGTDHILKKNGEDADKILEYSDDNTGEYTCEKSSGEKLPIYVKFRTCDNCIELDLASIMGIAIGDVVATIVIGVAVYLIASQARISPITSTRNKSSDRQHLVSHEVTSRGSEHYERLRHKGPKDTYDVIKK